MSADNRPVHKIHWPGFPDPFLQTGRKHMTDSHPPFFMNSAELVLHPGLLVFTQTQGNVLFLEMWWNLRHFHK